MKNTDLHEIYLAGGSFWGVEAYMKRNVYGVIETSVGYANGKTDNTSYQEIPYTDHAETVHIKYDISRISLPNLLKRYFSIINPVSINKQGNDKGRQYRTGIYYTCESDREVILSEISDLQKNYDEKIQIEVELLKNYILAEEYHQNYLEKNPNGYCHIDLNS